ncbi:FAD dependent oxidoreductase family protein 1 [Brevundimonas sp. G8]|nr:FAD dependent oxidoreductase family protein 1 [Brevundimonas sp. G8]
MVVGAGVIGLAIARALQRAGRETVLIEKESSFGTQTSSRSSEVIHAGIYYPAGSSKARYCVSGKEKLYAYCRQRGVPHRQIGKLIVAASPADVSILANYERRAVDNGVEDLVWVDRQQIATMEPAIKSEAGLHSPSTGIIDSHAYMLALLHDFEDAGGIFLRQTAFVAAKVRRDGHQVQLGDGTEVLVEWLINAAGHAAPAVATLIEGLPADHIPRPAYAIGHYYALRGKVPFNRLIYPVAEAGGLGVHVTIDMAGCARFGPDVRWIDDLDYAFDDNRRSDFAAAIQRYYPDLAIDDLEPAYTGIRPKIGSPDNLSPDFQIDGPDAHGRHGLVNLFGIESPGLTASLDIADAISDLASGSAQLHRL